jgi:hypothetical protein
MSGVRMSLTLAGRVRSIGKTEQSHLTIFMSLLGRRTKPDGWGRPIGKKRGKTVLAAHHHLCAHQSWHGIIASSRSNHQDKQHKKTLEIQVQINFK